jgi:ribose 5-phosphate isomerase A
MGADPSVELKRAAAEAALALVPERGVIGLGSGSTARLFIEALGRRVREGAALMGVPSSRESEALARSVGIPLLDDAGPWTIDVCFDGADEVDPALDVIKGGGGMHTREKIVIAAARRTVILVDESKLVPRLGTRWPVPVEVVAFGHAATAARLAAFGEPRLRARKDGGGPFVTDQGGLIYDVRTGPIGDAPALEAALNAVPGVVTVGLFTRRADAVIVAAASGVRTLSRASGAPTPGAKTPGAPS